MMMDDDGLLQGFFDESADLLADFEGCLLGLETTPGDQELLNRSFRAMHTIKGNSGMLGFDRIAKAAHVLEDLLDRLRKNEFPLTRPCADLLLRSADVIKGLLAQAKGEQGEEVWDEEIIKALQTFLGQERDAVRLDSPPPERAAAGDVVEISSAAEATAAMPNVKEMEVPLIGELLLEERVITPAQLEEALGKQKKVGEILVQEQSVTQDRLTGVLEKQKLIKQKQESSTIRVNTDKVDRLINLVGELVITQSMISQLVANYKTEALPILEGAVAQMERNTRELQERVMAIRMLPIRTVFSRLPRLVRDLAAQCGKKVAIQIKGEETELDKTVIERISDPLTHLIRNAVDHGIEPPQKRLAQGKSDEGLIMLNAFHQGGSIFIEIADDGRGLDKEKIIHKAVEQGLVSRSETLTDEQVHRLILRPGFSTAEQVTDVSGRGVGMDVVSRNIEELGGTVTISTEVGRGTRFTINLPLTLAILDGLSVQVGDEIYIIPLVSITESIRPKQTDLGSVVGRGEVVSVRGQLLPIVRLYEQFGVTPKVTDPTRSLLVIVEQEGRRVAILVDELLGQHQAVIKSLEANYQRMEGVTGATIMGDGRVALILDVPGLIRLASEPQLLRHAA
ncbi:chemotaxis protein CheA [Candidatus Methylomirabilis sp.]|uniref:chemotaxis protein CheA n=1 Tax=Candidatus Methylomirabilis sp. TaxID=2032687 RepID=UPI002A5FBE05|nr:chemotaxis protein CheA [Candidatus Methylomirabilis sp.]